jgi:iron complex outermembrane receptor protein
LRADEHVTFHLTYGYADSNIRAFAADPSVAGAAMPYVAKYNLGLSADYETDIGGDLKLRGHVGYRRVGPRSYTLDFPKLRSKAHDFADLRVGLSAPRWQLSAFADNLFNERQPEDLFGVFNGPVDLARQPNKPRTFGIELRYDFAAAR